MTMRFGQVQRLRLKIRRYNLLADLYIRFFGTTSLFALNCYWLLIRTLRQLDPIPRAILDAGCGKGDFTFAMAALIPDAKVLGIDISEAKSEEFDRYQDNIEMCQLLSVQLGLSNVRFKKQDLLHMDEVEAYDFIFCVHVLEHIRENDRVILNLARALRPGGYLYIQMPGRTDLSIKWLEPFLERRLAWEQIEHIACLTEAELKERVEAAGLQIVWSRSEFGYLLTLAWQGREALVSNNHLLLAALLLPWLKAMVWLHRWLTDWLPGPYRRWSLRLAGVSHEVEGNLELLAYKPGGKT